MATRIYCRTLQEIPSITPATTYRCMKVEAWTATLSALTTCTADDVNGERRMWATGGSQIPMSFYSERVLTPVTISGTITFTAWVSTGASFTGRLRARLYKVTAGGSNVESLICQADASADLVSANTLYTFTGTSTSTALVLGERLILRWSVTPVLGSFGTGTATLAYNEDTPATSGHTWIELTESVAFYDNAVPLYLRRTAVNAIGNFYDLLPVLGASVFTEAVVSTVAGGTEIQWTRTPVNSVLVTEITAAAIASTTNATTYASASYTPVVNRLYLLAVAHSDAAPESTVPTVTTTNGLAFVQVGSSIPFGTIASPGQRLTLFRAMKASGLSAGTHTVTLADAGTGCAAILAEVTGVVTTGANGADAVINISTNSADASANPSVTLAAFNDVNNGVFACFGANTQTAPTAGTGLQALSHPDYATPAVGSFAEWSGANDTTVDCVLASSAWAGMAVELVSGAGDTTVAEWISGRVKAPGFSTSSVSNLATSYLWCRTNSASSNTIPRLKLFKRAQDGTETLFYTRNTAAPITVAVSTFLLTGGTAVATAFAEDDRIIARVYIYNNGTMGGGYTCTLNYDGNDPGLVDGKSWLAFLEAPLFKTEGDPAGTSRIEGGQTMSGIGN